MAGGRFGVTWKLLQACVAPPVRLLGSRTCHIAYDSDDEQALARLDQKSTVEAQDVQEVEEVVAGPTFSDSEDEAEVEEEEEDKPATPPPAPKKKKVVRRRKKTAAKE
jgi:crotonobetainyl-CoA:carnitine CoA-transferase CaiB-like acyl-CoA transferase